MELLSLLPTASDPWDAGAVLAEVASDGKSLLPDSGLVVHGRGAGQGACCELLMLLVSVHAPQEVDAHQSPTVISGSLRTGIVETLWSPIALLRPIHKPTD